MRYVRFANVRGTKEKKNTEAEKDCLGEENIILTANRKRAELISF